MKVDTPFAEYGSPTPFDLFDIDILHSIGALWKKTPPFTNDKITDPVKEIENAKKQIQETYGSKLIYLGLAGSYGKGTHNGNSDLDMVLVLHEDASAVELTNSVVKLKVYKYPGIVSYLECGDPLSSNFILNSKPLIETELYGKIRETRPIVEKALPNLKVKSRYEFDSAKVFATAARRYKSLALHCMGMDDLAVQELERPVDDNIIIGVLDKTNQETKNFWEVYVSYLDKAIDRLHFSTSDIAEAYVIKRRGKVEDLSELFEYVRGVDLSTGAALKVFYQLKKGMRYRTELCTEESFWEHMGDAKVVLEIINSWL